MDGVMDFYYVMDLGLTLLKSIIQLYIVIDVTQMSHSVIELRRLRYQLSRIQKVPRLEIKCKLR